MKLVGAEFKERVKFYSDSWWPARELIVSALNRRHEVISAHRPTATVFFNFVHNKLQAVFNGAPFCSGLISKVDPSGEIVMFSQGGCPWKDHLLAMEKELNIEPSIKFALYADDNGKWRVQCVPVHKASFENRSVVPTHEEYQQTPARRFGVWPEYTGETNGNRRVSLTP